MDLHEYSDKLKEIIERSKEKALERIIVPPANKMLATIKNRIQLDGENSEGRRIGNYSTASMYVTQDQFDKRSSFKPIGKNEKKRKTVQVFDIGTRKKKSVAVKEDYTLRKSMYLQEGYKELRDIQGKPTDKVNATYRGDLILSYQQQQTANAVLQGLTSEQEKLKREGLEKHFGGKIMAPQKEEIDQYKKEVAEIQKTEIIKLFKGA